MRCIIENGIVTIEVNYTTDNKIEIAPVFDIEKVLESSQYVDDYEYYKERVIKWCKYDEYIEENILPFKYEIRTETEYRLLTKIIEFQLDKECNELDLDLTIKD